MAAKNGGPAWFSFPQLKIEKDGETQYLDILQLTNPEREHVRQLVLTDLRAQGHIGQDNPERQSKPCGAALMPDGEDLSDSRTEPGQDDIPF